MAHRLGRALLRRAREHHQRGRGRAAFIALWISAHPADANHPYGHAKAEYFSAVFEGLLVVLAALSILRAAYDGLLNPQPLEAPALGLAINAVALAINACLLYTSPSPRDGLLSRMPSSA